MRSKKASPPAILILTMIVIALCGIALFSFYITDKNKEKKIFMSSNINQFYAEEADYEYFLANLIKEAYREDKNNFTKIFQEKIKTYSPIKNSCFLGEDYEVNIGQEVIIKFKKCNFEKIIEKDNIIIKYEKEVIFKVS